MNATDTLLENLRHEVEFYGRSGIETIYKSDVVFSITLNNFSDLPESCNFDQAVSDFMWFKDCAEQHKFLDHPNPAKSWWVQHHGNDRPPGANWDFAGLQRQLRDTNGRRCVLINSCGQDNPPPALFYQFQMEDGGLHASVFMRSSDLINCLPQQVAIDYMLLRHVAAISGSDTGRLTYHLGNLYIHYEDVVDLEVTDFDVGF